MYTYPDYAHTSVQGQGHTKGLQRSHWSVSVPVILKCLRVDVTYFFVTKAEIQVMSVYERSL